MKIMSASNQSGAVKSMLWQPRHVFCHLNQKSTDYSFYNCCLMLDIPLILQHWCSLIVGNRYWRTAVTHSLLSFFHHQWNRYWRVSCLHELDHGMQQKICLSSFCQYQILRLDLSLC